MEKTGLLEKAGLSREKENYWVTVREPEAATGDAAKPVIAMDTAFSFVLYPEISLADALALGVFCSVKDLVSYGSQTGGTTVIFELSRRSAVRGFDQGIGSELMMEILNRLSHNRLDTTLGWTLKDWEKRHAGVSLFHGVVLSLAEDRRYLAEVEPVASLISRTLAPGVYLLSSEDQGEAAKALQKAGVDIIAQPPPASVQRDAVYGNKSGYWGFSRNSFPRLGTGERIHPIVSGDGGEGPVPIQGGSADLIKQKFHQVLDGIRLGKMEREELSARIERRLVLSETQLTGASLRSERLEARGLDYVGKSAVAKDAIATKSMVEISWPGPGGEIRRVIGVPQGLEKKEGESILVLGNSDKESASRQTPFSETSFQETSIPETIRIPLAKISLLRRIKQSIFIE
jgi:hypothetical protein